MSKYFAEFDTIEASPELKARIKYAICEKAEEKKEYRKFKFQDLFGRRYAVHAFSLAILIAVGAFAFDATTPSGDKTPSGALMTGETALNATIKGLPVDNYIVSGKSDIMADRVVIDDLIDMFSFGDMSFAIVKVKETKALETDSFTPLRLELDLIQPNSGSQVSTVEVLKPITGDIVQGEMEIYQNLYGGCTMDEHTNLLRKGGVYLLPFASYKNENRICGDLDVLFEIDNQGKIYSHSQYEGFNKYDGMDYNVVVSDIMQIANKEAL